MKLGAVLATCVALASCEAPSPSSSAASSSSAAPLDDTTLARVGDVAITADQVTKIAAAQRVSPAEARDLAVRDALFAAEAHARGLDADRDTEFAARALLARALVHDITTTTAAQGPVTDAELADVTQRHWTELDRPESARTVHAVVILKKDASADTRAQAATIARAIREAVASAAEVAAQTAPQKDPKEPEDPAIAPFRKAVSEVAHGALEVRVEPLPPVVADGRTLQGGDQRLEDSFARAAIALTQRGQLSPVVETSFGLHVLLLLDRLPAHVVPPEERRAMVREEVLSGRARAEKDRVLAALRPRASIDRSVDAILALVPVER